MTGAQSGREISTGDRGTAGAAVALLEGHIQETNRRLHEWVGHMVSKRHGLREAIQDYILGVLEVHEARPRLQHMLLEETPLPERLHQVLADAEHVELGLDRSLMGIGVWSAT